jgi:hypothetical protein
MTALDEANAKRDALAEELAEARMTAEIATASVEKLRADVERLEKLGSAVNVIRNSIVGMQGFNFSEHAYPLVAALEEAGFKGDGYELSRKNLGTLIEQTKTAEAERDLAKAEAADARAAQAVAAQESVTLREALKASREGHRNMCSYLGHQDQDANHEWMFRKMREYERAVDAALAASRAAETMREFGLRVAVAVHESEASAVSLPEVVDAVLRGES